MVNNSDSVTHTKERYARLRAEADRLAQEEARAEADRQKKQAVRDMKTDDADANTLEKEARLVSDKDTRDDILERVRQMREEKPAGPPPPPPLTDFMKQQLEIEQNAGREAIRKAEAHAEFYREAREKAAAADKAREGTMVEVKHPNPGMEEQFPASKATLGKTK